MSISIDSIRADMLSEFEKFEHGQPYNFDPIIKRMKSLEYVIYGIEAIRKNKEYNPIRLTYPGRAKNRDLESALEYAKALEKIAK